jgi:O-antigen/teichoic acid export membrane protein
MGSAAAPTASRIGSAVKWAGIGQVLSQAASYGMVVALAALLPPRAFGTVAIGLTLTNLASLLASSGTTGSMIAATRLRRGDIRAANRLNFVLGAALAAAVALLAAPVVHHLARGANVDAVRVMGLCVLGASLAAVPIAILQKALAFKRYAAVNSITALLTAALAVTAAFLGAGVWALVVRQVGYQALNALAAWLAARRLVDEVVADDAQRPHSGPISGRVAFTVVAASWLVGFVMDNAIVGAATDARQLGYYALAFTLGFAPFTQLGAQLGQVLFSASAATPDLATVARRTHKAARLSLLVLGPLVPVAIVLSPTLIPALFGDRWSPAVVPFQIFVALGVGHAVTNTIGEALAGTGNMRRRAPADALWAVATLAVIYVLVREDGLRGAAVGRLLVAIPLAWWYVARGSRLLDARASEVWDALRDVLGPILVQSFLTAVIWLWLHAGGVSNAAAGFTAAAAGLAAALALMWKASSRPLHEARAVLKLAGIGR